MSNSSPLAPGNPMSQVIFDEQAIRLAIEKLSDNLNRICKDEEWIAICVLKGGLVFCGHLLPLLTFDICLDYMRVSRYEEGTSGGELTWHVEPQMSLAQKNVLLIDDIFDEGKTLEAMIQYCQQAGAKKVMSAVLLNKLHERKVSGLMPDQIGLECPDRYVYGFGMDLGGRYRNLPRIMADKSERMSE